MRPHVMLTTVWRAHIIICHNYLKLVLPVSPPSTHIHSTIHMSTQDGVTADQVAEVKGHHAVCEELRKHMHGDRRPLSKVSPTCIVLDVA